MTTPKLTPAEQRQRREDRLVTIRGVVARIQPVALQGEPE